MTTYTIPKPTYPTSARLFAAVVLLGLAGLGIVAYETFRLFHGWVVALIFGAVIEIGAASESIALAGGKTAKRWLIPGLIVTLLVSGGYNYITAQRAGLLLDPQVTNVPILIAVGVGPLSAVFFIAAQLGEKIKEHEAAVREWEIGRQAWLDDRARQSKADTAAEKERALMIERQATVDAKRVESEGLERIRKAEIAAQERQEKRAARVERQRLASMQRVEDPGSRVEAPVKQVEDFQEVQRGTYTDFVNLLRSNGTHEWRNEDLSRKFNVSTRTVSTWRTKFQEEHSTIPGK